MPSESHFKKQAELVRESLKNFYDIRQMKSPGLIKAGVEELIQSILTFNPFIPFYAKHVLSQELVPAVFNIIHDYARDHPNFSLPESFEQVGILNNRVRGAQSTVKSGMIPSSLFYVFLYLFLSDVSTPVAPRADIKAKKAKTVSNTVCRLSLLSFISLYPFVL